MKFLGNTHKEIAFEKAGIIKAGTSLVTAVSQPEAQEVILNKAYELNVPAFLLNRDFSLVEQDPSQRVNLLLGRTKKKDCLI